uniref:Uncharacterized protein n=1 Tax=Setaria viridis TaxID=4556 RepID=A0A4U6TAU6_SETVI|nr:hypothetical protein SEVIR_9G560700v2 [Setaria viridis]
MVCDAKMAHCCSATGECVLKLSGKKEGKMYRVFSNYTEYNCNAATNSINERPDTGRWRDRRENGVSCLVKEAKLLSGDNGCAAECSAPSQQQGGQHDGARGGGERADRPRRDGGRRLLGLVVGRMVRGYRRGVRRLRRGRLRGRRLRRRGFRCADVELRRHEEAVQREQGEGHAVDDGVRDAGPGLAGVEGDVVALGDHGDAVLAGLGAGHGAECALDELERRLGVVGRQRVVLEEPGEIGGGHGLHVGRVLGLERVVVGREQGEPLVHSVLVGLEHAGAGGEGREHLASGALQEAGEVGGGRGVEEAVELDGRGDLEDGELEGVGLDLLGDGAEPGAGGGSGEGVVLVLLVDDLDVARGAGRPTAPPPPQPAASPWPRRQHLPHLTPDELSEVASLARRVMLMSC